MWMMFIKWIYTTQDLQSILSDTKEWFRFRRRDLVWEQVCSCSWHKHSGKEDERNFQSHVVVSTVQKLESKTVISVHSNDRVATDLENLESLESLEKSGNLKETSKSQGICLKSQGICDRIPKVREKSGNFVVWNSFSAKLRILILKIFWGSMPPDPLNGLGLMVELNLGLEKSGKSQGISYCLESGNPEWAQSCLMQQKTVRGSAQL